MRNFNQGEPNMSCCIEPNFQRETPSHFDAKVLDDTAIVYALPIDNTAMSSEYSDTIFIPWTERQLQGCSRFYIIRDMHRPDSLKATTREKRGKGTRRKVSHDAKLPMFFAGILITGCHKQGRTVQSSDGRCSQT